MASVGQGATADEDHAGGGSSPSALRIDTDVFATLTAAAGEDREAAPTIVDWFDCWRR